MPSVISSYTSLCVHVQCLHTLWLFFTKVLSVDLFRCTKCCLFPFKWPWLELQWLPLKRVKAYMGNRLHAVHSRGEDERLTPAIPLWGFTCYCLTPVISVLWLYFQLQLCRISICPQALAFRINAPSFWNKDMCFQSWHGHNLGRQVMFLGLCRRSSRL